MKIQRFVVIVVIVLLILILPLGNAAGEDLAQVNSPQAVTGTAFTYQGRLENASDPVEGNCDFKFSLWDAGSGGTQQGSEQTLTGVTLSSGYFTVALNGSGEFGGNAFRGEARYLQIKVKCSGDGAYTTLSGRVPLTPAPYALALPGLWTQQNTTSPNIIGGYSGNSVGAGIRGATIGGGGNASEINQVTDQYGTVGGGHDNTADGDSATVGGGYYNNTSADYTTSAGGASNTASEEFATVSGGYVNTASGYASTVGGGEENSANGAVATISGGNQNVASGISATVGGGNTNTASSEYAVVSGGYQNIASGSTATVGGGEQNTASGSFASMSGGISNLAGGYAAAVGGGEGNTANGYAATVGGGYYNTANHYTAVVDGGEYNAAGGYAAVVGGGAHNDASIDYATVSGGYGNDASQFNATVSGGFVNTASSDYATVGGGMHNAASGTYATVPGGHGAEAILYGQWAYTSGYFAQAGDAQASLYVLRAATSSNGTWEDLYLDGSSARLTIANNRTMTFEILIVGHSDGGESAGYTCEGVIENVNGTTDLLSSPCTEIGEDDAAWSARLAGDNSFDLLRVLVMGNGENIRWVATVRAVEVGW